MKLPDAAPVPDRLTLPRGIWLSRDTAAYRVWCVDRRIGWLFERTDGRWVADRSNGDYLDGDFESAAAALAALLGSRA